MIDNLPTTTTTRRVTRSSSSSSKRKPDPKAASRRRPQQQPQPVETCPSFRSGHLPQTTDVEQLRQLTAPHVESFNYFLDHGLSAGIQDMEPAELVLAKPATTTTSGGTTTTTTKLADQTVLRFWMENVRVSKPMYQNATASSLNSHSNSLLPRECRERRLMYAGTMRGMVCVTTVQRRNGVEFPGSTMRIPREFGDLPIMVLSKSCHLHQSTPTELVKHKEEVSTS